MKGEREVFSDCNSISRHYDILAKLETEKDTETIKQLCIEDINLLPLLKEEMKKKGDEMAKQSMELDKKLGLPVQPFPYYQEQNSFFYNIPRIPTFKTLAVIYEKEKNYADAIAICKLAISERQERDGTKAGMTGRLERLMKKAVK